MTSDKEKHRKEYTDKILSSNSNKKVVVAGPGTGKTFTFNEYLKKVGGDRESKVVMTFINPLVDDLHSDLGDMAIVRTFDSFIKEECEKNSLIKEGERYFLGANEVIKEDYEHVYGEEKNFSHLFNTLDIKEESQDVQGFVATQNRFYKFVDPSVIKYRLNEWYNKNPDKAPRYDLVIIDEFQDFNNLEAEIITGHLSENILLAGDDDQVLFEFKGSSPDCIRGLFNEKNDYESFTLPYCSRCPTSVVHFVNKIIQHGKSVGVLPENRCDKEYLPFKEEENESVVFIQYAEGLKFPIERELKNIKERGASVLILYPYSAKQEAEKLYDYLTLRGFRINRKKEGQEKKLFEALDILSNDQESNLGWRIVLQFLLKGEEKKVVERCYGEKKDIFDVVDEECKNKVLDMIAVIKNFNSSKNLCKEGQKDLLLEVLEIKAGEVSKTGDRKEKVKNLKKKYLRSKLNNTLSIEMCNVGNSKGLSADYVFIYPFSKQYFKLQEPKDVYNIIVALTRTKKKLLIFEPEDGSKQSEIGKLCDHRVER
ncbi:MAG: UvrD-helicase domain-containing protein [Candidatus Kaiserbacteria bacterium]|nr:UvrD-helicase domain-containing protein [Candidatus Kaiserbacteria bacterium]